MPTEYDHRSAAEQVAKIAAQHAVDVDEGARFPGATVKAAREAGLLGLLSAEEVGGRGFAHREAAEVIERIAGSAARARWCSRCTMPVRV
ncbi:MAG: acyl-CoA dehydrogenase family protein [Myxococcota bacterium]